jgi:hypothetical protein
MAVFFCLPGSSLTLEHLALFLPREGKVPMFENSCHGEEEPQSLLLLPAWQPPSVLLWVRLDPTCLHPPGPGTGKLPFLWCG